MCASSGLGRLYTTPEGFPMKSPKKITDTERLDFLGSFTTPRILGSSWKGGVPYWVCDGYCAASPRAAIDAAIKADRRRKA